MVINIFRLQTSSSKGRGLYGSCTPQIPTTDFAQKLVRLDSVSINTVLTTRMPLGFLNKCDNCRFLKSRLPDAMNIIMASFKWLRHSSKSLGKIKLRIYKISEV
jgi:hypothetical protein